MPKRLIACRLTEALLPLVCPNAPTSNFVDHCRYCSEKSGLSAPATMYRCSIRAVVEKIEHVPRRPWLRTGDCKSRSSVWTIGAGPSALISKGSSSLDGAPSIKAS